MKPHSKRYVDDRKPLGGYAGIGRRIDGLVYAPQGLPPEEIRIEEGEAK